MRWRPQVDWRLTHPRCWLRLFGTVLRALFSSPPQHAQRCSRSRQRRSPPVRRADVHGHLQVHRQAVPHRQAQEAHVHGHRRSGAASKNESAATETIPSSEGCEREHGATQWKHSKRAAANPRSVVQFSLCPSDSARPCPLFCSQEEMRRRGEDVDPSVMFDSNCITPGAYLHAARCMAHAVAVD